MGDGDILCWLWVKFSVIPKSRILRERDLLSTGAVGWKNEVHSVAADQAFLLGDQDVLTIVPESSILSGGSGGAPIIGGSVRIPTGRRVQVENLLTVVQDARV